MVPYIEGISDPNIPQNYDMKKSRPQDYPMVQDIIQLVEDANNINPDLCKTANDGTFAVLHLKWMGMYYHHWIPLFNTFLGGGGVKPGKMEAFATFVTPYLGQLFEGPIRHDLLTLGYLGGIQQKDLNESFPNFIWDNPKKKNKLKEFRKALTIAVQNTEKYSNLHARLKNWQEAEQGNDGEQEIGIPRIRNQIQHAHWFLHIENNEGVIVFPFLGPQPDSIKTLNILSYHHNLRIFLHTASSMTIGIIEGFKKAKIDITKSGINRYIKWTEGPYDQNNSEPPQSRPPAPE